MPFPIAARRSVLGGNTVSSGGLGLLVGRPGLLAHLFTDGVRGSRYLVLNRYGDGRRPDQPHSDVVPKILPIHSETRLMKLINPSFPTAALSLIAFIRYVGLVQALLCSS